MLSVYVALPYIPSSTNKIHRVLSVNIALPRAPKTAPGGDEYERGIRAVVFSLCRLTFIVAAS